MKGPGESYSRKHTELPNAEDLGRGLRGRDVVGGQCK
jgi:hypothetical protein